MLAWVRTGIALMGFGFVVARFGFFLREMAALHETSNAHGTRLSLWVGTGLVAVGVAVNLGAAAQHFVFLGRWSRGEPVVPRKVPMGLVVAIVLACAGVVLAVYLLVMHR